MEFKVDKGVLGEALALVSKAISNTAPIPVQINGVLINVKNDSVKLTGSDSDISIQKTLKVADEKNRLEVMDEGDIVLDARYLQEIVRKIDSSIITIEVIDGTFTKISGNKAEYDLIVNDRDNIYPKLNCLVKYVLTDISKQMQLDEIKKLFTASDNYDTELVIDFESNYLPLTPGVYYILASVSDSSGNKVSLKIAIIVVDNEAPVINVSGGIEIIEHNNLQEEQVIEHLKKLVGDTYEIISLNFDFNELLQYKETNVSYKIKNKYTNEIQEITSVLRLTSTQNNDNYINFTLIFIIMSTSITTTVIIFIYYRKKKNKLTS